MKLAILKNESEYNEALERMEILFDAPKGTLESDEADLLALIIDDYENKHYVISPPDPIDAIKIRMEEMNLTRQDMIDAIGGKSRVSEVLNRKRKLTLKMIRNITKKLNISPNILIKDY